VDKVRYTRIYADPEGQSHFADAEVELGLVDFAPPAPPLNVSAYAPAARVGFISQPAGWFGDWHPAPKRQFLIYTAGESEFETSDGGVRRVGPGSIVLLEDTTGKGHRSRNVGSGEVVNVVVQLPD